MKYLDPLGRVVLEAKLAPISAYVTRIRALITELSTELDDLEEGVHWLTELYAAMATAPDRRCGNAWPERTPTAPSYYRVRIRARRKRFMRKAPKLLKQLREAIKAQVEDP